MNPQNEVIKYSYNKLKQFFIKVIALNLRNVEKSDEASWSIIYLKTSASFWYTSKVFGLVEFADYLLHAISYISKLLLISIYELIKRQRTILNCS